MIIANPIYDVVFKYLLEDIEIARELLSTILGEEIVSLVVKPQETTTETASQSITIFRLDFKAVVKTKTGENKLILIELQKAKRLFDIMRFRRYLGENYQKEEQPIDAKDPSEAGPLPIVTIYFLGFNLEAVETPVLVVKRAFFNAATGEKLLSNIKEPFVQLLTHESYIIQIRRLTITLQTKLEQVLQVFSQETQTDDKHKLSVTEGYANPLVKKMVSRLGRAIASEEVRKQMNAEDEVERIFERELGNVWKKAEQAMREKEEALQQKEEALQQKEEERKQKEEALLMTEDLRRQIEALQKQINPKG